VFDLSIVMACYDDFRGLLWTIQSLKTQGPIINRCELIVLNNNPESDEGKKISGFVNATGVAIEAARQQAEHDKGFLTDWKDRQFGRVDLIHATERVGTSYPRDKGFRVASGKVVLCIDSHVILLPGTLERLIRFYEENPTFDGLVQGPMVYDQMASHASSMSDTWGAEMWGQWQADSSARDPDGPPFEIQAMGLGLFACRRESWLGFHPQAEGFGGEEWTIHEKYRKHGRKTLCVPGVRWWHDFSERQRTYPLKRDHKLRNYMVFFREIGLNLEPLRSHFRQAGVTDERFAQLLAEVEQGMGSDIAPYAELEKAYQDAANRPSDINEHIPRLRELASMVSHVTEFGVRTGVSTAGLLAGLAGREGTKLCSFDINPSPDVDRLRGVAGCEFVFRQGDVLTLDIEETDFLFIDSKHTGQHVANELDRHAGKVRRFIAFHDTEIFGERGEDGAAGLSFGIRWFLSTHPEWKCIERKTNNHGFVVLSRLPEDHVKGAVDFPTGAMIAPKRDEGPGTELKAIVSSLGVNPAPGCACNGLMQHMNNIGVEGCRKQFNTIVGQFKDNAEGFGWGTFIAAGFWATVTGLAFKLNPLDPFPGMVEEAIRRAEAKGVK
jgi:hypothetical protein